LKEKPVVNCPKCGKPLAKGGKGKYFCQNEQCSIIFVKCPSFPNKTRLVASSLAKPDKSINVKIQPAVNLVQV
jgi:hypothetical protein